MIGREESLEYHEGERPGKIEVRAIKQCLTAREMRLAYLPGAAWACEAIAADPAAAFRYTSRGNLVGVITDGSAVPGLGNVGPLAAKPMQEGLALLLKRLADIDAFDLEIETGDGVDAFVDTVRRLEPAFGGIVLKDIRAPEGLRIHERLSASMCIPVFHENLQSTAVVVAAALSNALDLVDKKAAAVRVVVSGAGSVGLGCVRLLATFGIRRENILIYDVHGALSSNRDDLTDEQRTFAAPDPPPTLARALDGADVFLGASAGSLLTPEMIRSMARFPIVFALATPVPEIDYESARASRRDVIVATSLTVHPNAIVDHLSFPFIMRGALDAHATRITDGMLMAAARALAELGREEVVDEVSRAYGYEHFSFGPEYLLPKPIDPRILPRESTAVARAAVEEGVARKAVDIEAYEESLIVRMGTGREMMRRLMVKARREHPRVVFSEGTHETVLRAASVMADEGIARPILLGNEAAIRSAFETLGVEAAGISIVDPERSTRREAYAEQYFQARRRHGAIRSMAVARMKQPDYFGAMMLRSGDADMIVSGYAAHYADSLRMILRVIGTAPGVRRISTHYMVLRGHDVFFLADCGVNIDPTAEDLAEIALATAGCARRVGIEPRVAMLSFSNFGSVDHPFARKVRRATELVKQRAPELTIDGEMQLETALASDVRREYFPFCELKEDANVLIFPDLQSGNLAMHLLQRMGEAVVVGPMLVGTAHPAHLVQYNTTVEDLVNLTAMGIVLAAPAEQSAVDAPSRWPPVSV
ncbi:MAG TPA: phosphate acyltransferase [Thermoanaerobaculia bacterium]